MVRNNPERPVQALFAIGSVIAVMMLLAAFLAPGESPDAETQAAAEQSLLEVGMLPAESVE